MATELALPIYFLHGVYDYTCSYTLAKSYVEQLKAPLKGFIRLNARLITPYSKNRRRQEGFSETTYWRE
jgi:hypothetical protein